ncbi:MAG: trigger factor [Candidatus Paceibacterota bacterium]
MKKINYKILNINNLPHSEVEIEVEIPVEELNKQRKETLIKLSEKVEISGFRKGHIPESVLVQKIGENTVLEETADEIISNVYTQILFDKKIDAIGKPEVTIKELASGKPVIIKIKTAIIPEIKISDYKKIAKNEMSKKDESTEVSDEELEKTITTIQKSQLKSPDEKVPELTDEFVKKFGNFTDVADFKNKVKEMLINEKAHKNKEKKRIAVAEEIVKDSKIDLPKILIDSELNKMEAEFKDNLLRMGGTMEDYLAKIKKSLEDLKKEWQKDAEKRAKLQLCLNKIAHDEKITVKEELINHETEHMLEHYKEADPERVRVYITSVLTNEEVFKFLEAQK